MQVEKKSARRRTHGHIFSLCDSLDFVPDGVLIQSIRSFHNSMEVLQEEGRIDEDKRRSMREALVQMEAEARRRGLKLPEESTR